MIKLNDYIVSSFVTENTGYEEVMAKYLLPSLTKFNIKHNIEVFKSEGSWLKNVALKPLTILHTMEQYPHLDVVFLDADAEILAPPTLFHSIPDEYDLACHFLDWEKWYGHTPGQKELLSGTMYIKNTDKMKEIVKMWHVQATCNMEWEQKTLERILKEREDVKIYALPIEYIYITTLPNGEKPKLKVEHPIILHHQMSRKLKKTIKPSNNQP
jgi:hypothetical protein